MLGISLRFLIFAHLQGTPLLCHSFVPSPEIYHSLCFRCSQSDSSPPNSASPDANVEIATSATQASEQHQILAGRAAHLFPSDTTDLQAQWPQSLLRPAARCRWDWRGAHWELSCSWWSLYCGRPRISSVVYAQSQITKEPCEKQYCCENLANYVLNAVQTIFADGSYPKPFFVTYTNTSMFIMPLFFIIARRTWTLWRSRKLSEITSLKSFLKHLDSHDPKAEEESILRSGSDEEGGRFPQPSEDASNGKLGLKATAKLSVQFCLLWVSHTV